MEFVPKHLLVSALGMQALFVLLGLLAPWPARLPEALALLLGSFLLYLPAVWYVFKPRSSPASLRLILGAALLFRLTAWSYPVFLSDDVYRYRWEARVQAAGANPYSVRPTDARWSHLLDHDVRLIPAWDRPAGYGPLVELIQLWAWRLASSLSEEPHGQARWFRLPAAAFDLGAILALLGLLRARGQPLSRILVYAWSPLVIIEFWGMGHNDAIVVAHLAAALYLAARERWVWSFAALSLAALAKFWPLALFPLFIGWNGRRPARPWQWLVALPIGVGVLSPFLNIAWAEAWENARYMSGFVGGWRNNDSLYGLLLWLTGDQYNAKYLAFALVGLTAAWVTVRRWPLERGVLAVTVVLLLVSSNCHPWYLTWIAPLLALYPFAPLLLWTALMPLAYEVVLPWQWLGQWEGSTSSRWLIYIPVFAMFAVSGWLARRRGKLSIEG